MQSALKLLIGHKVSFPCGKSSSSNFTVNMSHDNMSGIDQIRCNKAR